METTPELLPTRSAQLNAGDLYLYRHDGGASVGFMCIDPAMDGDRCEMALGPTFPSGTKGPHLLASRECSAVSFGPNFRLILPVSPTAWHYTAPPSDCHCVAVNDQAIFFRANWERHGDQYRPCYIDIQTGKVHAAIFGTRGYTEPPGIRAYAAEWILALPGEEGAVIYSYKWAGPAGDGG